MKLTVVYASTSEDPRSLKYFIKKSTAMQYLYTKRLIGVGDWSWDKIYTEE